MPFDTAIQSDVSEPQTCFIIHLSSAPTLSRSESSFSGSCTVHVWLQEPESAVNNDQQAGMNDEDLYSDDEAAPVAAAKRTVKPAAKGQVKGATPGNQVAAGRVAKRTRK